MLHFTILRSYRWPVLLACVIRQDCIILRHHHFRPPIRPLIWLSAESRMCLFLRFRPNFFGCRIFGAPLAKIFFILTRRGHLTPSTAVLVLSPCLSFVPCRIIVVCGEFCPVCSCVPGVPCVPRVTRVPCLFELINYPFT